MTAATLLCGQLHVGFVGSFAERDRVYRDATIEASCGFNVRVIFLVRVVYTIG